MLTRAAIVLACALVAALAFAPALHAGFHPEDFAYVALMRHLDAPWPLVVDNVFFVYYYRATGLLVWWLSVQAFGTSAFAHNALDLAIHAANAALLAAFVLRATGHRAAALCGGLAFACLPAAATTAMWMSDRYDPLALLFGLVALIAFERAIDGSRRAAVVVAVSLLLAIAAKEVAYTIAGVMLVRLAWRVWERRGLDRMLAIAVVAPVLAVLALRMLTVQSLESSLSQTDLAANLVRGVLAWWQRLPAALAGFQAMPAWVAAILFVFGVAALATIAGGLLARRGDVARLALAGGALLVAPSLLQWPVTSLVLVHDGALAVPENLRFYHLAMAGLALLVAAAAVALREVPRAVASFGVVMVVLCGAGFAATHGNATRWADSRQVASASHLALGARLAERSYPPGCRIELDAPQLAADIRPHIDVAMKAAAPRGSSILGCRITAGTRSYVSVLDGHLCNARSWPALTPMPSLGTHALQRIGNLCMAAFDDADGGSDDTGRIVLDVDARGNVVEPTLRR